jgi:3-oxoacyl-[acyl-carrier protein] reductase
MVTGAGRGICRAVAVELAAAGMSVALVARSEDQLADTAQQVKQLGAVAVVVPADLADLRQVTRAIHLTTDQLGTVDVLINAPPWWGLSARACWSTRLSGPSL